MISLKNNKRIFPLVGAIVIFVLTFSVLYFGDNVGLSDNGDFRRVLLVNNLEYEDDDNYYYLFKQDYKMQIEGDTLAEKIGFLCKNNDEAEIYDSPHFVIIKASKIMNFFINTILVRDEDYYDIGCLAFIYTLMFAFAAWGIFTFFADSERRVRIAVFVIFIVMFCDAGYILYFNSFYGEPLQYISVMMLIAVGLLIYKRPTIPKVACFFVSLYFFAGSKLANVPYAVIVSLLALSFSFLRKDKRYKIGVGVSVLVAAIFIANLYVSIPDWMHDDTTYQSVFFGAVKESETPEKDLKEFGIDEKYLPLVNTHAYMNEDEYPLDIKTDEFRSDFYDKITKMDVVLFYMRHPVRFINKVAFAIENASCLRPLNLGTSETVIMDNTNRYSMWSNLRVATKFLYNPLIVFLLALLLTAYVVMANVIIVRQKRETNEKRMYHIMVMYVLLAGLWINMCLPIIGNGEADIMKHMFLFENCMDILFAGIILCIVKMHRRGRIVSILLLAATVMLLQIERPRETIEFGQYNGNPIKWEVMETQEDGSKILVTRECIEERQFDAENNMWETSGLRTWLNTVFLVGFSDEELSRIDVVENEVMLTYNDRNLAESGNHTHIWSAAHKYAADLGETAYKYTVMDYVFIPTLDMMESIDINGSYWILCPYGYNDKMQRYMKNDGFVLHTNVDNERGVRAAIKLRPADAEERRGADE